MAPFYSPVLSSLVSVLFILKAGLRRFVSPLPFLTSLLELSASFSIQVFPVESLLLAPLFAASLTLEPFATTFLI